MKSNIAQTNSHCINNATTALLEEKIYVGNKLNSREVESTSDIRVSKYCHALILLYFCCSNFAQIFKVDQERFSMQLHYCK